MEQLADVWKQALPKMMEGVSGVGVWTALKLAVPVALDEGVLVVGVPSSDVELGGHLRVPMTIRSVETVMSQALQKPVKMRVIDGTTPEDYELVKRRDAERRRMQEAQMAKERAELASKNNWDGIYEQLSRRYASVPNRTLPQNRARFFEEAVEIVAGVRREQTTYDDLAERNFARCIERISQYTEISSAYVALEILKRANEI